jgi:hypothetical protein
LYPWIWWSIEWKSWKVWSRSCPAWWESGVYSMHQFLFVLYAIYIKCSNTLVSLQVQRFSQGLGTQTNNSAEYKGLLLGLKEASNQGYEHVHVRGDSQLVCKQVSYLMESMHWPILVYIWQLNLHLNEMNDDKKKNIIQLFTKYYMFWNYKQLYGFYIGQNFFK